MTMSLITNKLLLHHGHTTMHVPPILFRFHSCNCNDGSICLLSWLLGRCLSFSALPWQHLLHNKAHLPLPEPPQYSLQLQNQYARFWNFNYIRMLCCVFVWNDQACFTYGLLLWYLLVLGIMIRRIALLTF